MKKVKNIFLVALLSLHIPVPAQAYLNIIGEGTRLTYEIIEKGATYNLLVTIRQLKDHGDADVIFDWEKAGAAKLSGTIAVPKSNTGSSAGLIFTFTSGNIRLQKDEVAFFFPRKVFQNEEYPVEVNGITYTMKKTPVQLKEIALDHNGASKNFPYWKIKSAGSFPDTDFPLTITGIQAKLDAESDEQWGSSYKLFSFIQYASFKDFEMKLINIKTR